MSRSRLINPPGLRPTPFIKGGTIGSPLWKRGRRGPPHPHSLSRYSGRGTRAECASRMLGMNGAGDFARTGYLNGFY
jgi:hypothetical protein